MVAGGGILINSNHPYHLDIVQQHTHMDCTNKETIETYYNIVEDTYVSMSY